ncbi:MAG: NTP transferase domain-containing protein [Caldiserica bacterium]|nr:NTP transferase domain-containing protein [Caldisericota bacterium]
MTTAVVLAAGHADRMGSNKLILPLGTGTVVGRVVATALAACDSVMVVIGLHDQGTRTAVEQTARALGAEGRVEVAEGVPYDPGMFISVQAGLRRVAGADVVLIFPGDIPLILPETAIAVKDAVSAGRADVAVPSCGGRQGHPVAVSARCVPELLAMSERSTLRQFMTVHASTTKLVPVDDRGMLLDMDAPDEYDRVLECLRSAGASTKEV